MAGITKLNIILYLLTGNFVKNSVNSVVKGIFFTKIHEEGLAL